MMMNCWKTVNINKEFGLNRIYCMSIFTGLLSFLLLYVPFSMIHDTSKMNELGILPLLLVLLFLPLMHRLMHILPLILLHKPFKMEWQWRKRWFPTFTFQCKSMLSKQTCLIMALSPTMLITVPVLIMSCMYPKYFAYLIVFAAVNIGLSFSDFLYVNYFARAPKKCVIENGKDGFDILIRHP